MRDLKLEPNSNNLTITNLSLQLTSNVSEYVSQKIRILLSFFLGEWFLDNSEGIPYFDSIFVKNPNLVQVGNFLKKKIISVEGVKKLTSFTLTADNDNRRLELVFSMDLSDGTPLDETLVLGGQ